MRQGVVRYASMSISSCRVTHSVVLGISSTHGWMGWCSYVLAWRDVIILAGRSPYETEWVGEVKESPQ